MLCKENELIGTNINIDLHTKQNPVNLHEILNIIYKAFSESYPMGEGIQLSVLL